MPILEFSVDQQKLQYLLKIVFHLCTQVLKYSIVVVVDLCGASRCENGLGV